jgi:prepilin-type N-terminal cleavage/methylation domain-containing protein
MCAGGERGFTLVEAVVALFILGLAVVAMEQAAGRAVGVQAAAARRLEAVSVADWKLNELAALPSESLAQFRLPRSGVVELGPRRYHWQSSVRRQDEASALWEASVAVAWDRGRVDLRTLFYRPPERRGPGGS